MKVIKIADTLFRFHVCPHEPSSSDLRKHAGEVMKEVCVWPASVYHPDTISM